MNSGVLKDMGGGGRRTPTFGPFSSAQAGLSQVGSSVVRAAAQQGALAILTTAFPQFSPLIVAGYAAYKGYHEYRQLRTDFDRMEGPLGERLARLGALEGAKLLSKQALGNVLDKFTDQAIEMAVHNATYSLSQSGVFSSVARHAGLPQYSDDLRYFFMTTAEGALKGAYSEAKDQLSTYVARGLVE